MKVTKSEATRHHHPSGEVVSINEGAKRIPGATIRVPKSVKWTLKRSALRYSDQRQ
jgi:hypothetical protein